MTTRKAVEALTAPELLKRYRSIVSPNTTSGRDLHALKEALLRYTPVQLLAGFYWYQNNPTLTVHQFLRQETDWLIEDEQWAGIELARLISHTTPKEYYLYQDLMNEETTEAVSQCQEAFRFLAEWAERILQ